MIDRLLNSRIFIVCISPFFLGLVSVFSFQPFNLSLINFFIFPLLFYLVYYVKKKSRSIYRKRPFRKNLFFVGYFFGFGFYLSGIFWISYSLTFEESFKFLIPLSIILIPLFLGLFMGATTLIVGQFINLNFNSILLFASAVAFSDFLRGNILTGFPWNLWSYSWSWLNEVLQLINILGTYAFNLVVITIFLAPIIFIFKIKFSKKILLICLISLFVFSNYIYGSFIINKNTAINNYVKKEDKAYVKVISPNFDLKYYSSLEEIKNKLKRLIKYSEPEQDKKTLFVWPEGIFTGYSYEEISEFKNMIEKSFSKKHLILFGINTTNPETGEYFNSLIVVNNKFEVIETYNKKKLVPFGEFIPFEKFLSFLGLKKITQGYTSFSKGQISKIINLEKINLLPLICYEIIFPELIQNNKKESNLIVNISEDGWFGNSIGPHQHYAKAIFRSIENDTYLVRSANKGISAIINNKGEVIKKLKSYEAGSIDMHIPLLQPKYKNKNDLIFFILLFTYLTIFLIFKTKNNV